MRIVSLLPAATEIAGALGLRDRLVGVSHECDHPPGLSELPRVTSSILGHDLDPAAIDAAVAAAGLERRPLYAVDGELLAKLRPDVILTQGVCAVCAVTPATVEESLRFLPLDQAFRGQLVSLEGLDFRGVVEDVRTVGRATGTEDRAAAVTADMERRWEALAVTAAPGPRVLMLEWPDPPWFGGHWVPEQVAVAGGRDLFGTSGAPSGRLDWNRVVEADPEVIVAIACGFGVEENARHARQLLDRPELAEVRAVRHRQLWAADANAFFSRPAPRLVDGAELLRDIFASGAVPPERAVRLT